MTEFLITDSLTGAGQSSPALHRLQQTVESIGPHCSEELALIRILMGTVHIEHVRTGLQWSQARDYSVLGGPISSISNREEFRFELENRGLDCDIVDKHLRSNLRQSSYYSELCGEVLYSIYHEKSKSHTLGFLHIYRFLERISFAFPLIYSARSKDFKSAYTALKDFIDGTDKGELNFFKKFIETSIDPILRDATTKLDFSNLEAPFRAKTYATVKQFINSDHLVSDVLNDSLEIRNIALLPLIVTLRNRFFHFLSSNSNNLTTQDIPDSDIFFSCLNAHFLNWLAVIYFEVLRHNLRL
jgi:hypothetical protein